MRTQIPVNPRLCPRPFPTGTRTSSRAWAALGPTSSCCVPGSFTAAQIFFFCCSFRKQAAPARLNLFTQMGRPSLEKEFQNSSFLFQMQRPVSSARFFKALEKLMTTGNTENALLNTMPRATTDHIRGHNAILTFVTGYL